MDNEPNYVRDGLGVKVIHAGSTAVRNSIPKHQPMLGLHGHITNPRASRRLERPPILIQAASMPTESWGALLNIEGGKVKEFLLTSG